MDEFGERIVLAAAGQGGEAPLQQVFDGLDVVVGLGFDRGEFGDVVRAEPGGDRAQGGLLVRGQGAAPGDHLVRGQVDQPLDLDAQSLAVEGGLGEVVDEGSDGAAVTTVERTQGDLRIGEARHTSILPSGWPAAGRPSMQAAGR